MHDDKRLTSDVAAATVGYPSGASAATVDYHSGAAIELPHEPPGIDGGSSIALDELSVLQDRVLGDFVLGQVLGEGGCGTVYRAEQRALGRPAVVKVVHRSLTARRDAAERFAREARLASRFDHPYAAHVYAFGIEHDGLMWIAMELVDGTPLGQLVRQSGPLAVERFVPLFERLCEVVQSAHDQGIVHRDIKPSNVMVIARAGRLMPKLLDFGIAKLVPGAGGQAPTETLLELDPAGAADPDGVARGLTHEGQVLGSPAYMAPEQWHDATTAGPLADQYALALLAYEALSGSHAFAGPTVEALAEQHRHAPLPALPPHLPAALHAVLARASDKLPEGRFANLTELANALRIAALGATGDLEEPTATLPEDIAPYPGLAAYTATDRESFVGRERDVLDLVDRLATQAIVTVVGPSGSGKTSFLAAGLVPSLEPRWHAELVRPGSDPPGVLAAIAERLDAPPYREGLHRDAPAPPAAIAGALVGLAETRGIVIVVIVDQAEELFTMCASDAGRAAFAEALVLASASPRIRVVLALRDDFLCRIEQLPAWRGLLGRAVHVLGTPRRDDLERMVTVPARRRGFGFDDPALPREIVDQVADRPGALPLVAFTAAQLWEHRDRRLRRLTRAAYERIGGVTGALVQHADSVVDRMSVPDRRQVRLVFRRLLTAEGARALISRGELESSLDGASAAAVAAAVIDRLLAARLIVSRDDDTGDRIEIIHETLATTWPRLAAWRREDAAGARLAEQIAVAARHWDERGRPADLLWRGDALSDLGRWQATGDHGTTPVERAFTRASIASAGRVRRTRIGIVASAFALLLAGVVGLVSANRKIADQRAAAVDRLSASFQERGRVAIGDGDDAHGMLYLAEATRLGARGPGLDLLTSHAAASLDAGLEIIGHTKVGIVELEAGPAALVTIRADLSMSRWDRDGVETHLGEAVYSAALIGDLTVSVSAQGDVTAMDHAGRVRWRAERAVEDPGTRSGIAGSASAHLAVSFGKTATLWDVETGRPRGELRSASDMSAVALDARGALVATGDVAGVVRIWDTATAQLVASCEAHAGGVRILTFALDGRSVVSGGNDGDVRICDTASGATIHRLIGHSHQIITVDIAPDGRTIVSGGRDGKARVWDARTGVLVRILEGHRGTVTVARFSPDGSEILTLGVDGIARIWNRDGTALGSLQGHGGPIYGGGWERDGRHVLTTSFDGAIRRWDTGRATTVGSLQAHAGVIADLAISDDDRWVLTAGADRRAIVWDRRSRQPVVELAHDAKVESVMFGPDGSTAVTTDSAGTARIWRLPAGTVIAKLAPGITAATFTRDGQVITAGAGKITFWSQAGVELGSVPLGYTANRLVLDPSGRWLFARGETSSVLVVDVAARAALVHLAVGDHHVLGLAVDGSRVALTDGAAIRLWQLGSWAPRGTLAGHKSLVTDVWFLPGGRLVSAAADATLVWSPDTRLLAKLADTNFVFALATSPDGALMATTGSDGAMRIWDTASYGVLLQLPGHRLPALALQITHDGATAISGGDDGRVLFWDVARRTHPPSALADTVRCRVPLRLEGDTALPRDLDFDDPTCRSLALDR